MNTRIQTLMDQAMELVDPYAPEGEVGPKRLNPEKFAELILFECVKIAVFRGDATTGRAIQQHFGVEE